MNVDSTNEGPKLRKCLACCCNMMEMQMTVMAIGLSYAFIMVFDKVVCDPTITDSLTDPSAGAGSGSDLLNFKQTEGLNLKQLLDSTPTFKDTKCKVANEGRAANIIKAKQLDVISNTIDCFYESSCSPCNGLWNKTVTTCTEKASKDFVPQCFQKVCKDVKSMYHTLFLLFIVLAVGLLMSLVSVCTACGRGSAPVITPLLMLGAFVASVLAFVVGGFSISFLSTPYNKLLAAFANDFAQIKQYTWAVFLPCYLGIAHMIWAQFQLIPNFIAYKSSKAFVNFNKNGDYAAMGTNPASTANYGAANN